nr:vitellin-c [Haemaphysalis flava]
MRMLWLLLLAVAAASGFEVGKEYVYDYNATMRIENPEHPLTSLGINIYCNLIVQPMSDHTHFKIVNFNVASFNFDNASLHDYKMNYMTNDLLSGVLEHPFAAKFDEGKIDGVYLGGREPLWSRNMKKGMLALFQLDLVKGRHEHPDAVQYHVNEDGLQGHCDTLYIVREDDHGSVDVTKMRNLEKCDRKADATFMGRKKGKVCVKGEADETHPISATSETKYALKGTAQKYVIDRAWATSTQLFKPHGDGKEFSIFVGRKIHLREEHDATTNTELPGDVEKGHSLAQEFPATGDLQSSDDLKHANKIVTEFGLSSPTETFIQGLDKLAQLEYTDEDIKEIDNKESGGLLFILLSQTLMTYNYEQLNDVYHNHVANAAEDMKKSMREVFIDMLAAAGMNPHLAFGINLIQNKEMSAEEADRFYTKISLNFKEVSTAAIKEISDSCKLELVKSHAEVWTACKLAASFLASGQECRRAHNDQEEDSGSCSPDIVSHMFNHSVTPWDVVGKPEYINTVYIRVAGNLATRRALLYLKRFIWPKWHAAEHKRMVALWALKQAAEHQPELARSIAFPVFENTSEPSEIRIAAFQVTMATKPDLYLLRHIALEAISESSDQVAAFVSSAFRSLAKSKYPCHGEIAQHLRYVLPMWENEWRLKKPVDKTMSHLTISSGYNPKYDFGGMTMTKMIRARDSFLPRNCHISMKDYVAGKSYDTIALSFESWGLDRLFNGLVGPQPGSTKSLWNVFGRRRFPRDASAEARQEIENSLPIPDHEYDPMYARLSLSMFGKTVDSWNFDESTLNEIKGHEEPQKAAESFLGKNVRSKTFYLTHDMTIMTATDLGLPVFFSIKQGEFIYAKRENIGITHGDMAEINLDIKRHYLFETRTTKSVGVPLTFFGASIGTASDDRTVVSWPLELKATLSPLEGKLSLHRPMHLPWNVVNHHSRPFTFIIPSNVAMDTATAVPAITQPPHPLYRPEELKHFDRNYFGDLLGMSLNVKGHLIENGLQESLRELFHEMTWRERFYYLALNPHWHPRDVKMYIVPSAQDATKAVDIELSYKFLESDDPRESHFSIHDQIGDDAEVLSTHVLKLDVHLKGDTKDRSVASELRYSFSHDLFKHKLQFFYDRSQFSKDPHSALKICLDASAKFPVPDWSKATKLDTFYLESHVDAKLDLHYGDSCEAGSSITIDGKFTQTDEDKQQLLDAAAEKPLFYSQAKPNVLHKIANYCKEVQKEGFTYNFWCMKLLRYSSRLGKLTANVEYKNYKPLLHRLVPSYGSHHLHTPVLDGFIGVVRSHFTGENGKLSVVSQVPWWTKRSNQHTDIVIKTEDGHRFHHPNVPIHSHLLEPRVYSSFGYSNIGEYSELYRHRVCDLQSNSVRTFDGYLLRLPETDCYKVISRDCSPNRRFVLLARATNNPKVKKAIKLFIHTTMIELLPVSDDSGLTVRVDGTELEVTTERPYSHTSHDAELFEIQTQKLGWYELVSKPYGIYIITDGNALFIQVAPFYRGKLCGICGDYNLDRQSDLTGPDDHRYRDTAEFAKSYVVPSPDCHPPNA